MKFKTLKAVKLADQLILPNEEIEYASLGEAKQLVIRGVLATTNKADQDKLMGVAPEVIQPIQSQIEESTKSKAAK